MTSVSIQRATKHDRELRPDLSHKTTMNIKFIDLEPAFNGVRGWISFSELYMIDPNVPGSKRRFSIKSKDWTAHDGTVFVYALPIEESVAPENK